ncbi:hypothetical protein MRX96_055308 [Rhipicephalus microplus]
MPAVVGYMRRRSSLSGWLPVLLVLAGFCWAYYAYVHVFCPVLVADRAERVSLSAFFHLILLLALWSFLRAVTASIPPVPSLYYVNAANRKMIADCKTYEERREILEALGSSRGILTRAADGSVRYCEQCGLIKPDRCHHCSCCRRCILKMDHHCPWLNNCVAFGTYKFFLLTLFYVVLLASYTFVTVSSYALDMATAMGLSTGVMVHTGFLVLAGTALMVLIGGFFGVHVRILCRNETTLEALRPFVFAEAPDSFDLGIRINIIEVFGSNVYLWPFPRAQHSRGWRVTLGLSGRDLPVVSPPMETTFGDLTPSPATAARHISTTTSHGERGLVTIRAEGDAYDTDVETKELSPSSTLEPYRSGLAVSAVNGDGTAVVPVTPSSGLISTVGMRLP